MREPEWSSEAYVGQSLGVEPAGMGLVLRAQHVAVAELWITDCEPWRDVAEIAGVAEA